MTVTPEEVRRPFFLIFLEPVQQFFVLTHARSLSLARDQVDDILARKQQEFDAYEAKEMNKKVEKQTAAKASKKNQKAKAAGGGGEDGDNVDMKMMMELVGGMKDFMGKVSSFEGAEFPSSAAGDEAMSFDADRFLQIMQQALGGSGLDHGDMSLNDEDESEEEPDEFFGMGSDEVS
jgi:hypothetical protein